MVDVFRDVGREDFEYVVSDLCAMPTDTIIVADIFAPYMEGIARVAESTNMGLMLATDTFQREMIIKTSLGEGEEAYQDYLGGEQLKNYIEGQHLFSKYVRSEAERLNLSMIETGGRLNIDEMCAAVCRYFELPKTP